MKKADKAQSDAAEVEAGAQPKPRRKASKARRGPTEAEIRAAMVKASAAARASEFEPGKVIGLDAEQWQHKIIPLDLPQGRIDQLRLEYEATGWSCEPDLRVAQMNLAEVWVMPRVVWLETVFAQRKKADAAARANWGIGEPRLRF